MVGDKVDKREFYQIGQDQKDREERLAQTPGGERFLNRCYEIGRARPLRHDEEQGE